MDVRKYVKVKTLPGGTLDQCKYYCGHVFTKNLTHKKMRNDIKCVFSIDCVQLLLNSPYVAETPRFFSLGLLWSTRGTVIACSFGFVLTSLARNTETSSVCSPLTHSCCKSEYPICMHVEPIRPN